MAGLRLPASGQGVSTSLSLVNRAGAVAWPRLRSITKTTFWLLGLGPLLERMPTGLCEMVGASGWQLSPRERGRVFLARALLQGADLVVQEKKGRRARSRELGEVP